MPVLLRIGERAGEPVFEPTHVELNKGKRYRLLSSPGLAYGVAAEDEIELEDDGRFEVVTRGGNLAVRLLSANGVSHLEPDLTPQIVNIGGRLDGQIHNGLAYTIPNQAGRKVIENCLHSSSGRILTLYGSMETSTKKTVN